MTEGTMKYRNVKRWLKTWTTETNCTCGTYQTWRARMEKISDSMVQLRRTAPADSHQTWRAENKKSCLLWPNFPRALSHGHHLLVAAHTAGRPITITTAAFFREMESVCKPFRGPFEARLTPTNVYYNVTTSSSTQLSRNTSSFLHLDSKRFCGFQSDAIPSVSHMNIFLLICRM